MLFNVSKEAASRFDSCWLGFSTGKESLCCLDLLHTRMTVRPFFMYLVKGLEFQELYLQYIEKRYKLEILRLPHWALGGMFRGCSFRPTTRVSMKCPKTTINDIEALLRAKPSAPEWFAYGLRISDSIVRRAMLNKPGGRIQEPTKRFYPLADWNKTHVLAYLRAKKIPLPADYRLFGSCFSTLEPKYLIPIKKHYPNDYEKIRRVFPEVEAVIVQEEIRSRRLEASKVRDGDNSAQAHQERAVQPAHDQRSRKEKAPRQS